MRTVKLLHVEDDELQRLALARHLSALPELAFAITCADSEDAALAAFAGQGIQFVVLDYHLSQGNGLQCLHRLRRLDPIVPIVAVSGVATPEIACELIKAGADDYISKKDLTSQSLASSVRAALARSEALRPRVPAEAIEKWSGVESVLRQVCAEFLAATGPRFLTQLDELESAARAARVTPAQIQLLVETTCAGLETAPGEHQQVKHLLRPILLEILVRLFGEYIRND